MKSSKLFFSFLFSLSVFYISNATGTTTINQTIRDGETIVSSSGIFELGFFSPKGSRFRYLGTWYKFSNETLVWVANREMPLIHPSGILQLTRKSIMVLNNLTTTPVWSSNYTADAKNPVAKLLDSGNLVVTEAGDSYDEDDYLWQSFDFLGDTLLPGVKLGKNLVTGNNWNLVSWVSTTDLSSGVSTVTLDPGGYPQYYIKVKEKIMYRSGPWNGLRFSGVPTMKPNPNYKYSFVYNEEEIYYKYDLINKSVVTRMMLNDQGLFQKFTWNNSTRIWNLYLTVQLDDCDIYAACGAFGSCNINKSPTCTCLKGFRPKIQSDWDMGNWTNGCIRRNNSVCGAGEGFQRISGVKLPDTNTSWFNKTMDLRECETVCLKNCTCTAYSVLNVTDGSGCLLWFGDLIDIREYTEDGQDFYIRLAASDLDPSSRSERREKRMWTIVACVLATFVASLALWLIIHFMKKRHRHNMGGIMERNISSTDESREEDIQLPLFNFSTIATATQNFSGDNKLGEGGFGPVYKGTLQGGQEIAVKRLSKDSNQGLDEFKNEVVFIAKLQHRNLVKLLGCCIDLEEKMLIYEYMPNKSLDAFIFDKEQRKLLYWPLRFNIINGIARGLLYLHQDSRLRIIHRDLKASNILLDQNMNPKISDFGMAKSFAGNELQGNTKRIVGTYGYMSPEYAIDGLFSIKSDVFSFGVLILEIATGKRNRGFYHPDHSHNLLGHAWKLYKEGKTLELMDVYVKESCIVSEVLRSIHVGLLCVQKGHEDRPNMSNVVLMLSSDNIALPEPKEPGFFTERKVYEQRSSSSHADTCSVNDVTISLLTAR